MALEGTADHFTEVDEIRELYPSDNIPPPEVEEMPDLSDGPEYSGGPEDGFHVEALQSAEDVEVLLAVESGKASAVMDLAESTLVSAINNTGDAAMFADETAELASMAVELQALGAEATSIDFTETYELPDVTDTSTAAEVSSSIVDGVGVYKTNSGVREDVVVSEGLGTLPAYETIESVLP